MTLECGTPASGRDGGSEQIRSNAGIFKHRPPSHPRQARPVSGFTPIGELAVNITTDLRFRRQVEQLCERPRLAAELLAEIAVEHSIRGEIERKLTRYLNLDQATLAALRADRFPPVPLYGVEP